MESSWCSKKNPIVNGINYGIDFDPAYYPASSLNAINGMGSASISAKRGNPRNYRSGAKRRTPKINISPLK
jgi:hypothetical protein